VELDKPNSITSSNQQWAHLKDKPLFVTEGLKTIVYPVKDLAKAKTLYSKLLGVKPDMDEAYYVGFTLRASHVGGGKLIASVKDADRNAIGFIQSV
jgi:hypothetical protein